MNQKENGELKSIAKHVCVLNEELGHVKVNVEKLKINAEKLKTDMGWVKKILFAIAGMIFIGVGKVLFFG